MGAMPPFAVSPILRAAAELKIDELKSAKAAFESRYCHARRSAERNTVTRIKSLIEDVRGLLPESVDKEELKIMARYVDQAQDDLSISESKILKFEERIYSTLGKFLNRFEISSLHVEIMQEAMNAGEFASATAKLDDLGLEDAFDLVENEHEHDAVLENFEKEAFTTEDVDVMAIEAYLSSLFADERDQQELHQLRAALLEGSDKAETDGNDIDEALLTLCMLDLLKNDSISDDKKRMLQDYLQSPVALSELVSTINTKSLSSWEYKNAEKGLPVRVKQDSAGQRCIAVEEELIDMLFLHIIGHACAAKLKTCLDQFARRCKSLNTDELSMEEMQKRAYFLARTPLSSAPPATTPFTCAACHPNTRNIVYMPPPPPPPPPPMPMPAESGPPPVTFNCWGSKRLETKKRSRPQSCVPACLPPPSHVNLGKTRNTSYQNVFSMFRSPSGEDGIPTISASEGVQVKLMKTIATEMKLREAFDGMVYAGTANFEALASSLPHKTVLTVLKFLGVPEMFIRLFERFLSAKLNIGPAVRARARGVPEGHALEMLFTEAIMFFLELVIRQNTGSYLYRLKDSCYFVGNHDQHKAFEVHVAEFAEILGLKASLKKTISIGLLDFNTRSVTIVDDGVGMYARRVKKQLSACTTVIDWIRIWNDTAGTYAAHLFGPLADIFGKAHLDAVRTAYRLIFDIILDEGNLTTHVQNLLTTHLHRPFPDPSFPLEAFIYLPQAYGGLGVKNPFIAMNLAHEIHPNPDELITKYLEAEDAYYKRAAENWALLPATARARKIEAIFDNNDELVASSLGANRDIAVFMTKDELTEHRERTSYPSLPVPPSPVVWNIKPVPSLTSLYSDLLREPDDDIPASEKVIDEVNRLRAYGISSWYNMSAEDKWVLQLYSDECFERYGGLEMWVGEFMPQEVLKVVRGRWGDDDDEAGYASSVSDMTEP